MKFPEQRKSVRFPGQIPVVFRQGTGLTRDYSADGVYFVTGQTMSLGEQIELVMLLDHQSMVSGVRLRCSGNVVRVEYHEGGAGVAVATTKHLFELAPEMAET